MRLESEHTHYRTRFEMYGVESPDDVLPHILQVMYSWLCDKEVKLHKGGRSVLLKRLEDSTFNYHVAYPDHVSTGCYTSRALLEGMSCPISYDGGVGAGEDSKLRSQSLVGNGDEACPQYWAMDYDEPDTSIPERRWHTSVGVVSRGKRCIVSVRVTNYLLPTYVGNPPSHPVGTTPNFVKSLFSCRGFQARIGDTVLSERFTKVRSHNYKKTFLTELLSPERELPLIVVATDHNGKPPTNVTNLSRKVPGMARVLLLDLSEHRVRDCLHTTFVKDTPAWEHRIAESCVRIYKPGVKLRSAVDARRHRLFTEEDIERLGLGFNDMLVRSLTRSWTQDDEDVVDVLDVASRARRQRNAELRRRLDELTKASEKRAGEGLKRDRGLEESATIDELRKLLEERDQTIYKLEGESNLWQGIAEEYANDLEEVTTNTDKKHEQTQAQLEGYRVESAQKDEAIVSLDNQVSRLTFDLKTAWAQVQKLSEDLTHATGTLAVRGGQSRKFFNDSSLVRMSCCAT